MRCLRSIVGVSRFKRIRNSEIRRATGSEKAVVDAIQEKILTWYGQVCRMPMD